PGTAPLVFADEGNHSTGVIFIAPVGMKPLRVARGAESEHFNLRCRNSGGDEALAIRFGEVDVRAPGDTEFPCDLRSDFITTDADAGSDRCIDICRVNRKFPFHLSQSFSSD